MKSSIANQVRKALLPVLLANTKIITESFQAAGNQLPKLVPKQTPEERAAQEKLNKLGAALGTITGINSNLGRSMTEILEVLGYKLGDSASAATYKDYELLNWSVVVLIRDAASHNYTVNEPVILLHGSNRVGLRHDSTGNTIPRRVTRPATVAEINECVSRLTPYQIKYCLLASELETQMKDILR